MSSLKRLLTSSIGKKLVMAITGIFLFLFLIEHLYGNALLYFDDNGKGFNEYSHSLVRNIIIRIIEVFLFAAIVIHVIQSIIITRKNSTARPIKYAIPVSKKDSTWFARNMGITGSVVFFFIVIHLYHFFVPYRITHLEQGYNLAQTVRAAFQNNVYVIIYVVGVVFLFFHLLHSVRSSAQTLGLNNKKYSSTWNTIGAIFAWIMFIGFVSFPLLFHFNIIGTSIILPQG